MRIPTFILLSVALAVCSGCASYIPPSGRANLSEIASPSMRESFEAKPQAGFPAGIAMVRLQGRNYHSYYTEQEGGVYGRGRYSVVTSKDIEEDSHLQRISKLPNVGGLITISTVLLPENLQSETDLREAAARLKADMVLLYTFDTTFHEKDSSAALTAISLGLSPTHKISVNVAASALLIDTRTGFIYAALEANEKKELKSAIWNTRETADQARRDAEKAAFKGLVGEWEKSWSQIVDRAKKGA